MAEANKDIVSISHGDKTCRIPKSSVDKDKLKYEFGFEVRYLSDSDTDTVVDLRSTNYVLNNGGRYTVLSPEIHQATRLEITDARPRNWLAKSQSEIHNALILSFSTYKENPYAYLDEQKKNHTFTSIVSNVDCKCPFVTAEDSNSQTVYLAFKGTSTLDDLLTDLQAFPRQAERTPSVGTFHTGFLKRAEAFPLDTFLRSDGLRGKTLILCGHSLGGAVSSVIYLEIAQKLSRANEQDLLTGLRNITFGCPLFASHDHREYLLRQSLPIEMYHFVAHNDPVPRIVTLVLSALNQKLSRQQRNVLENTRKFLEKYSTLIFLGLDVRQYLSSSEASAEKYRNVKSFLKACVKPPENFVHSMEPIGHFFFLKNDTVSVVNDQDRRSLNENLRIGINQINLSESLHSHLLPNYRNLCEINNCFVQTIRETEYDRRALRPIRFLNPEISHANLEYLRNSQILKLTVEGSKLFSIQKQSCLFDFGFEFGGESTSFEQKSDTKIVLARTMPNFKASFSEFGCDIQVVNLFGKSWKYLLTSFSGIQLRKINEIAKNDDVILVLETAFKRASDLFDITGDEADNPLFGALMELAESVLEQSDVVKLRNIYLNNEGLHFNNEAHYHRIHEIMQSFKMRLQSHLKLELTRSNGQKVMIVVGVVAVVALTMAAAYALYCYLAAGAAAAGTVGEVGAGIGTAGEIGAAAGTAGEIGAAAGTAGEVGTGIGTAEEIVTGIEIMYNGVSKSGVFSEIAKKKTITTCVGGGLLSAGYVSTTRKFNYKSVNRDEYHGILDYLLDKIWLTRNSQMDINFANGSSYEKEKALMSLFDDNLDDPHDNFRDCELETCSGESKDLILERIRWITQTHKIRDALSKQCYIGVGGPKNAGKSKFLKESWNCDVIEDCFLGTLEATAFKLSENVFAVDYPGSNSLEEYRKALSISGSMNNITLIVVEAPRGPLDNDICRTLRKIYEIVRRSERNPKTILCFNHCVEKVSNWQLRGKTLDSIKDLYVQQLNTDLERSENSQNEPNTGDQPNQENQQNIVRRYRFTKEDIHLTDWGNLTAEAQNFGIVGVREIKIKIKRCLQELEIVDDEEILQLFPA